MSFFLVFFFVSSFLFFLYIPTLTLSVCSPTSLSTPRSQRIHRVIHSSLESPPSNECAHWGPRWAHRGRSTKASLDIPWWIRYRRTKEKGGRAGLKDASNSVVHVVARCLRPRLQSFGHVVVPQTDTDERLLTAHEEVRTRILAFSHLRLTFMNAC